MNQQPDMVSKQAQEILNLQQKVSQMTSIVNQIKDKIVTLHYAKKEAFIFQIGLPAEASLQMKSAFSITTFRI